MLLPVKENAQKKYFFTYTDDVFIYSKPQNQQHPVKLNWNNQLKGVSEYLNSCGGYKFISADESRSVLNDSECDPNYWIDHIIPEGKRICKVETII
jgi:hypothetical protein